MTTLLTTDGPIEEVAPPALRAAPSLAPSSSSGLIAARPVTGRSVGWLIVLWIGVAVLGMFVVLYALEPLFQQREQRLLLDQYRVEVEHAANASMGLPGIEVPKLAPETGSAVGVLEVGPLQMQQVVTEGVSPSDTARGPGHVPGTAAPGQPGNSVIVGRRGAYGGPFGDIDQLHAGDAILLTTTQGQSVYKVDTIRDVGISTASSDAGSSLDVASVDAAPADDPTGTTPTTIAPTLPAGEAIPLDAVFGSSKDDRLTLVTSATRGPLNASIATVVVAKLQGEPFTPTPQNGRTTGQIGTAGDATAWAPLILALLALVATVAVAVYLYRRSSPRVAYLLTISPLVVFMIVTAESLSRLLPAWM